MEDGQYEICHNKDMGDRLYYHLNNGAWNDIPFKPDTFGFLPKGITAMEIGI
jgi:hypothetical protein